MQRSAILAALALFSVALGHDALAAATESTPNSAGLDGRYGLVFGFDGNRFSPFDGAMFALRKQVGQRTGLRLGLTLGFMDRDRDRQDVSEIDTIWPDTTDHLVVEGDDVATEDGFDLEVDLLLIRHAQSNHRLQFFYGAGPTIRARQQNTDSHDQIRQEGRSTFQTRRMSSTVWSYGLRLVAGVEYFFTNSISVHAEYGAGVVYSDQDSTYEFTREIRTEGDEAADERRRSFSSYTAKGWSLSDQVARFGVSLFF